MYGVSFPRGYGGDPDDPQRSFLRYASLMGKATPVEDYDKQCIMEHLKSKQEILESRPVTKKRMRGTIRIA